MKVKLLLAGALALAAGSGFLASVAFSGPTQAARTVTINLRDGATGPAGPRGPTGPSGAQSCPAPFESTELVVNHPGGQVTLLTCVKGG